jgi:aspartate/methionine/tyrosine aminotransferase
MLDTARRLLTASRRSDVPPFMVMDVMSAAARIEAAGGHVIHMEVGQPFAPAPAAAIEAARAALGGRIAYTEALGMLPLRERIALHYREQYSLPVDPGRVIVTTGSSAGFIFAFLAMFEPGDRIGIANPGYPPYRHILSALGCEPVLIHTREETRWAITPEALIETHRKTPLAGVLVASPANPTGTMMSGEALRELIEVAEGAGIRFISDEIYHGLDYAFPAVTAASLSPNAMIINSFSKYFCMTGWRIGAGAVADRGARGVRRTRGDGCGQARLSGEPADPGGRPAEGGARQIPSGRRGVLSLCRHFALLQRQPEIRQGDARGHLRGRHAGD